MTHTEDRSAAEKQVDEARDPSTPASPEFLLRCALTLVEALADELSERLSKKMNWNTSPKRLLEIDEAAHYIGRTANALRILESKGRIRAVRTDGRVMFDVKDLDAWIESGK
jgi:hypothetical protein